MTAEQIEIVIELIRLQTAITAVQKSPALWGDEIERLERRLRETAE